MRVPYPAVWCVTQQARCRIIQQSFYIEATGNGRPNDGYQRLLKRNFSISNHPHFLLPAQYREDRNTPHIPKMPLPTVASGHGGRRLPEVSAMPVLHSIIHKIDKKPDGSPAMLHCSVSELAESQARDELVNQFNESYNSKTGKAWGFFHAESGAFPFSG